MPTKCHVMVVDDERDFRESAALLLELEGFEVSQAAEGEEALRLVAEGVRPHIILLDQRMPGLTGIETLQELRKAGHAIAAVLVSAVANLHELARAHRFDGALGKPFNHRDLTNLVRDVLRGYGIDCD